VAGKYVGLGTAAEKYCSIHLSKLQLRRTREGCLPASYYPVHWTNFPATNSQFPISTPAVKSVPIHAAHKVCNNLQHKYFVEPSHPHLQPYMRCFICLALHHPLSPTHTLRPSFNGFLCRWFLWFGESSAFFVAHPLLYFVAGRSLKYLVKFLNIYCPLT